MAEIAKSATDKGNRVLFVVHRRELVEQIKQTFTKWGVDMNLCQVGMVQTISNKVRNGKIQTPKMILVDECHHAIAKTYQRIFSKFHSANVIGFTATPARLGRKQLDEVFDDLILGPEIDWLIKNHFLAPYKYYSTDNIFATSELKVSSTGDYSFSSMEAAGKSIIYGNVVDNYRKFADGTKTIVYTYNVESSKQVANEFLKAGYTAEQVDGKTEDDIRQQAMENFRTGKTMILTNASIYGEGIDVPDCETVMMIRPTKSLSLFIQSAMRAMRYKAGKTATIIDMVENWKEHQLPDTKRKWSITSKPENNVQAEDIIQCDNCLAIVNREECDSSKNGKLICPECGEPIHNAHQNNGPEHADAEFIEITPEKITLNFKAINKGGYWQELHAAKTRDDLVKIQQEHGYKPGWVWYQMKQKNITK